MFGMSSNESRPSKISIRFVVLAVGVTAGIQLLYGLIVWIGMGLQTGGQFGDMFGTLNPLFSGLALFGVIYSIHLQSQELALQREELTNNRLELKRSADAQEAAQRALNQQLEAARISAQLEALPMLIRAALDELRTEFPGTINLRPLKNV